MKLTILTGCIAAAPLAFLCLRAQSVIAQEIIDVNIDGQKRTFEKGAWDDFQRSQEHKTKGKSLSASTDISPQTPSVFPRGIGRRAKIVPLDPAAAKRTPVPGDRLPKISTNVEPEHLSILDGFRLRAGWDPVKLFKFNGEWIEEESAANSDGAEFGWSNNRMAGTRTWTARGVAYMPYIFHATSETQFLFVPSIEFNRDTGTDGTANEINSIIPRLGIDFNFVNHLDPNPKGYVIRTALGYQTDFDFKSGQWLFDLQYEPVSASNGVGVFSSAAPANRALSLPGVRHKFNFAPIFTVGSVQDAGKKITLEQLKDAYATIGAKAGLDLELEFLPNPFNTIKIGAEYRWWAMMGAQHETFDYFEAHLTVPIVDDNVSLKAFYRRGDTPNTLEKADLFGIALSAKF